MVSISNTRTFPTVHKEKQNDTAISIFPGNGINPFLDDARHAEYMSTGYPTDPLYEKSCMLKDGVVTKPSVFSRESRVPSRGSFMSKIYQTFFFSTKGHCAFILTTLLVSLGLLAYMINLYVVSRSVAEETEIVSVTPLSSASLLGNLYFQESQPAPALIEHGSSIEHPMDYETTLSRPTTFVVNHVSDIKKFRKGKHDTIFINASLDKLNTQEENIFNSEDAEKVKTVIVKGKLSEHLLAKLLGELSKVEVLVLDVDTIERGMRLGDKKKWPIPNLKNVKTLYLKNCIDCTGLAWIFKWKFQNLEKILFQYVNIRDYMLKPLEDFVNNAGPGLSSVTFISCFCEANVVSQMSNIFPTVDWHAQNPMKHKLVEPQEDI